LVELQARRELLAQSIANTDPSRGCAAPPFQDDKTICPVIPRGLSIRRCRGGRSASSTRRPTSRNARWRCSGTTRKITDEGWTRRIAHIATTLALLQVAEASDSSPVRNDEAEKIDGDTTLRREADAATP
jgi:hypothetical protein